MKKTIAIIGAKGVVGKTLVEFFTSLGHEVLSVDKDTELTLKKAATAADVVFIATLPIEEVGGVITEATTTMRIGTLLVHCTSIENPVPHRIHPKEVYNKGKAFCHLHPQFRPEAPLASTLFGQHITISGGGPGWEEWRQWIFEQFENAGAKPLIHEINFGEHDHITSASQLIHMLVALLVCYVWGRLSEQMVRMAMKITGPPGRFLIRSVLRVAGGPRVVESTVYNHPHTLKILDFIIEGANSLRQKVQEREPGALVSLLVKGRAIPREDDLLRWDKTTGQFARMDADRQETTFEFVFPPAQNVLGLLANVLKEFDLRRLEKTTTFAIRNGSGGCTFVVGVSEDSESAREAARVVRNWQH